MTPTKRRRTRAAGTRQLLWTRTRWSSLSDEDEQERGLQALVAKSVAESVLEAKSEITKEVANFLLDRLQLARDTGLLGVAEVPSGPSTAGPGQALAPSGNATAVVGARLHVAALSEHRVQAMIDESWHGQLLQIAEVFREGFANVVTKSEAEQYLGDFLKEHTRDGLEALGVRVSTLETGAALKKEGLRRRIDKVDAMVHAMDFWLKAAEQIIAEETAEDASEHGWPDEKRKDCTP